MKNLIPLLLAACLLATPCIASARTKLVALPDRASMVLSLENPNQSLLYEERDIPLQRGTNHIDFMWTGVRLDERSVRVEFLTHPGDGPDSTRMIAVSYPPGENSLTWQVYAPEARTERVRVSYILHGISQSTSYELRMNAEETAGDFRQYLLLMNRSGEQLEDTVVRVPSLDDLSRSIASGEARRFLALREQQLPITKLYIARPAFNSFAGEEGEPISLAYEIENNEAAGLGRHKLPFGKVRVFGDDGMDSSIFLGEDSLTETPPGEMNEVQLGRVSDVKLKRFRMKHDRENIQLCNGRPMLFDIRREVRYEVENFKDQPVTLKIHEPVGGEWVVEEITADGVRHEKESAEELIVYVDLPAADPGHEVARREVIIALTLKNRFPNENP